jgi:integrase
VTFDRAAFRRWLLGQDYRVSTARKTVDDVALARRLFLESAPVPRRLTPALRRYLAFIGDRPAHDDGFLQALVSWKLGAVRPRTGPPMTRKKPRRSFQPGDWQKLTDSLSDDHSPSGACLWVLCSTGLRVGDLLRLDRKELQAGLRRGVLQLERKGGTWIDLPVAGADEPWQRLLAAMTNWKASGTVATLLAPDGADGAAGGAAYQRLNRYLRALGTTLKLTPPVHLHRIRRTVAVLGLRLTEDVGRVQQLLGHASPASTHAYLDELRQADVADLQERLAKLRKKP